MTVAELIELLRQFPATATVIVLADEASNRESFPYQVFEDESRVIIDTSYVPDETDLN